MSYYYYSDSDLNSPSFKITLREALLSTVIIAILIGLGLLISEKILDHKEKEFSEISASIQINTPSEFDYCKRTDVGKFMAEGYLVAKDSVCIDDISGYYMQIVRKTEKYQCHTRTYTTTDAKGHVSIHVETYYSWDVVKVYTLEAESLTFLEQEINVKIPGTNYHSTKKIDQSTRYVFYITPSHIPGIITGEIENHTISATFKEGTTMNKEVDKAKKRLEDSTTTFWILWSILIIGLLGLFFWGEYNWLERN